MDIKYLNNSKKPEITNTILEEARNTIIYNDNIIQNELINFKSMSKQADDLQRKVIFSELGIGKIIRFFIYKKIGLIKKDPLENSYEKLSKLSYLAHLKTTFDDLNNETRTIFKNKGYKYKPYDFFALHEDFRRNNDQSISIKPSKWTTFLKKAYNLIKKPGWIFYILSFTSFVGVVINFKIPIINFMDWRILILLSASPSIVYKIIKSSSKVLLEFSKVLDDIAKEIIKYVNEHDILEFSLLKEFSSHVEVQAIELKKISKVIPILSGVTILCLIFVLSKSDFGIIKSIQFSNTRTVELAESEGSESSQLNAPDTELSPKPIIYEKDIEELFKNYKNKVFISSMIPEAKVSSKQINDNVGKSINIEKADISFLFDNVSLEIEKNLTVGYIQPKISVTKYSITKSLANRFNSIKYAVIGLFNDSDEKLENVQDEMYVQQHKELYLENNTVNLEIESLKNKAETEARIFIHEIIKQKYSDLNYDIKIEFKTIEWDLTGASTH